jgi:anti-anti-sigma factor
MTRIEVTHHDDALIARPSQDIDMANSAALEEELAGSIERGRGQLIVDLGGLRYIDSAGLDMLIRLSERLRQRRSRLAIVLPESSRIARLAEIVDLPAALPVYPTVADAVASGASNS